MIRITYRLLPLLFATAIRLCWLGACFAMIAPTPRVFGQTSLSIFAGTWTGTSTCVGNRPACKNEIVVYRFVPVAGHPKQLRLFADKIIEGKRVPMGALVFELNERTRVLESEFKIGHTHGIWSYAAAGDSLTGKLIILPERSVARDVKVHRVKDSDVPAAPALREYDE
ncbi:MAG: hypothetical protein ILNGONEN_01830 [Syntrophorhabdaceae bacterium]|nr:hypothetical protein [Syntrophorhabdaceae bacterium]